MSLSPIDQDIVTVVLPTHNGANVVAKTIESVVWQRETTDGEGSPDGSQASPSKIGNPAAIDPAQITEQHKTRNDGARFAQPTWSAFCDDGDLLAPINPQWQDAGDSRGADWRTFGATSLDKRVIPVGWQCLRESDPDRLSLRLLETSDVERAMEWPNPYRAFLGEAAS